MPASDPQLPAATDVTLRDGSRVEIRPIERADAPLLAAVYAGMSPESRRRRFLAAPDRLSEDDLDHLTGVDHVRHEALLALDAATGAPVGEARYVRVPGDRETAEVAAAVVEDWHGRGVATALLNELTDRARANGLRRYTAVVSADNLPVIAALERQGARRTSADSDDVELSLDLPTAGLPERMNAALRWAAVGQLRLLGGLARRIASRA